jgi:hypothetical protein
MKTRNGFVANSSSSSFLIALPGLDASRDLVAEDIATILYSEGMRFPEDEDFMIPGIAELLATRGEFVARAELPKFLAACRNNEQSNRDRAHQILPENVSWSQRSPRWLEEAELWSRAAQYMAANMDVIWLSLEVEDCAMEDVENNLNHWRSRYPHATHGVSFGGH